MQAVEHCVWFKFGKSLLEIGYEKCNNYLPFKIRDQCCKFSGHLTLEPYPLDLNFSFEVLLID